MPERKGPEAATERVLITVKTYPTLSLKYGELVCTAGLREDGSWVRIYPVPFRALEEYKRYKKYQWLDARLVKNRRDPRPESYKPDQDSISVGEALPAGDWRARRDLVLGKGDVHEDLSRLIEDAKANRLSLATFRPARIRNLVCEPVAREWDSAKIAAIRQSARQGDLFDQTSFLKDLRIVRKLPYKFRYEIEDCAGRTSTMMIEDWEIGQLYWNCLKQANGDEGLAIEKVRRKYLEELPSQCDLHLFLGTTLKFQHVSPNPFLVVGVFYPPKTKQLELGID